MKRIFVFALFAAFALKLLSYEIYSDFPGGNIKVVGKTGNKATVTQDYRDSDWWFYWNFGVRGAEGKTIIFNFVNSGDIIGFRRELRRRQDLEVARLGRREAEKKRLVF